MSSPRPTVSVIMRTKNSAWVVKDTLEGLYAQDYLDFELLVVDSGSQDRTLQILAEYPARLIQIEPTDYFPGAVLNMAIKNTTGEIIVFLNSDAIPQHPQALSNLLKVFEDPLVQAAYARQIPRPEAHGWVRRDYAMSFPAQGPPPPWITLSLPMAALRRTIWEQRPFYTQAWASEDTEWGHWARSQGHRIEYVANAIVMHSHNYTLRQIYGRRFVEGEADAIIYGCRETIPGQFLKWLTASMQDMFWCVETSCLTEIPSIPVRRLVYSWAYLKGHRLGEVRRLRGDQDTTKGQRIVLSSHDK